ncbi:four helix bundle protein [Oscillatoria laete-virens NRMC-F 0139]|nr:four helix bundle protein [Oscillatoria laete-virens]MDL5055464.1 four helix bundle protein [Oscillatoria laete-virens NRMC-F 0139]
MKFEDLEAWKMARVLVREVYAVTAKGPFNRDLPLKDQMRRAAVSIMSNIAEGFERVNKTEKLHFYNIARASAGELRSQIYICLDQGYINHTESDKLLNSCENVGRLITGLMRSFKKYEPPA